VRRAARARASVALGHSAVATDRRLGGRSLRARYAASRRPAAGRSTTVPSTTRAKLPRSSTRTLGAGVAAVEDSSDRITPPAAVRLTACPDHIEEVGEDRQDGVPTGDSNHLLWTDRVERLEVAHGGVEAPVAVPRDAEHCRRRGIGRC
jgi:hypothetical protein